MWRMTARAASSCAQIARAKGFACPPSPALCKRKGGKAPARLLLAREAQRNRGGGPPEGRRRGRRSGRAASLMPTPTPRFPNSSPDWRPRERRLSVAQTCGRPPTAPRSAQRRETRGRRRRCISAKSKGRRSKSSIRASSRCLPATCGSSVCGPARDGAKVRRGSPRGAVSSGPTSPTTACCATSNRRGACRCFASPPIIRTATRSTIRGGSSPAST